MDIEDISKLLDNKALTTLLWTLLGGVGGWIANAYRNKLSRFEYTVSHSPIALSGQDKVLGTIAVTWQGTAVQNLHLSTVEILNATNRDFKDVKFITYTGKTRLLNERTEVVNAPYAVPYSPDYIAQLAVPAGQQPTQAQYDLYATRREYLVPALNRGQALRLRYLTTVQANEGPAVWVDGLFEGVKFVQRRSLKRVHGVPLSAALGVGLMACVAIYFVTSWYLPTWLAALACLVSGLVAQSIGAMLVKIGAAARRLIYH